MLCGATADDCVAGQQTEKPRNRQENGNFDVIVGKEARHRSGRGAEQAEHVAEFRQQVAETKIIGTPFGRMHLSVGWISHLFHPPVQYDFFGLLSPREQLFHRFARHPYIIGLFQHFLF